MQKDYKRLRIADKIILSNDSITKLMADKIQHGEAFGEYYSNDCEYSGKNEHIAFLITDFYIVNDDMFIDIKILDTYYGRKLTHDILVQCYAYFDSAYNIYICSPFKNHEMMDKEFNIEGPIEVIEGPIEADEPIDRPVEGTDSCEQCVVEAFVPKYDMIKMELVLDTIKVLNEVPEKYELYNGNIWFKDFMFHFFDNTLRYTGQSIDRTYFIARGLAIVYKMQFLDNNLTASSLCDTKDNYPLAREYYS